MAEYSHDKAELVRASDCGNWELHACNNKLFLINVVSEDNSPPYVIGGNVISLAAERIGIPAREMRHIISTYIISTYIPDSHTWF